MRESRLNIGIIGVGHIAQIGYIPSIKKLKDRVNLYALCDLDEAKLYKAREIHGANIIYTDFEDLLSDPDVDCVIISTPNHLHYPMSFASISFGKHTLCELPPALNLEEARELKFKIEDSKNIYMPAMNYSMRPDIVKIKELIIEKKLIGDVFHAKFIRKKKRYSFSEPSWMRDPNSAGSIFHSSLVHSFEVFLFLFQRIPESFIKIFNKDKDTGIESEGTLYIKLDEKISILFEVLWEPYIESDKFQIEIYGEKGNAYLSPFKIVQKHFGSVIDVTPRLTEFESFYRLSFEFLLEHFINCIEKKEKPKFSIDEGIKILEIIEKIRD